MSLVQEGTLDSCRPSSSAQRLTNTPLDTLENQGSHLTKTNEIWAGEVVRCDGGTTPLIDNAVLSHSDKGVIIASDQILMDLK